ncbi:MAG TPA: hypothetical protein VN181_15190 [Thermoanaerobaculia bacterium]|nr:hypothetical protein [Thermoanaerobaculia bacterium]
MTSLLMVLAIDEVSTISSSRARAPMPPMMPGALSPFVARIFR